MLLSSETLARQELSTDVSFCFFLLSKEAPCKVRLWGFVDLCVPEFVISVLELHTNLTSTLSFSMWTGGNVC
jgi:hypothetical protein